MVQDRHFCCSLESIWAEIIMIIKKICSLLLTIIYTIPILAILFTDIITHATDDVTNEVLYKSDINKGSTITVDTLKSTNSDIIKKSYDQSTKLKNVTWIRYIRELVNVTTEQFDIIKDRVKFDYNLDDYQIESIEPLFNYSSEYKLIIHTNLKRMTYNNKINKTVECMLDYTIKSNWILEKIVEHNLDKVKNILNTPTKWYNQTIKDKIQRQETKAATNRVNSYICKSLSICRGKRSYTNYVRDWLRRLLSAPEILSEVFAAVIDLLEKHKHFIKSNVKFQQTMKYIFTSGVIVQKDTIDFLDETLTNRKNVLNFTTDALMKDANNLIDLFAVLKKNYIVNDSNKQSLDSITTKLGNWIDGDGEAISSILNVIVENMKLNLMVWPVKARNQMDEVWTDLISL